MSPVGLLMPAANWRFAVSFVVFLPSYPLFCLLSHSLFFLQYHSLFFLLSHSLFSTLFNPKIIFPCLLGPRPLGPVGHFMPATDRGFAFPFVVFVCVLINCFIVSFIVLFAVSVIVFLRSHSLFFLLSQSLFFSLPNTESKFPCVLGPGAKG